MGDELDPVVQQFLADVAAYVEDIQMAADEAKRFAASNEEAKVAVDGMRDSAAEAAPELGHLRDEALAAAGAQRELATAERDAGRAAAEAGGADGMGLLITSLIALAPAVIPAVAAVGVAAGALAPALLGAASGALLFKEVAQPAFAAVELSGKAQAKALAALPPSLRQVADELIGVKNAWHGFQSASGTEVAGGIVPWAATLKEVIGYLPSILGPAAQAIRTLGEEARTALGSPFWKTFFSEIGSIGGLALRTLGEAAGHAATGLAHLALDFIPVAQKMLPEIDKLALHFQNWADSAKGSGAITNLIEFVKQHGPEMVTVVRELAQDIPKVVRALAGFSGGALSGISVILTVIGKLSPGELQLIAGAIIAVQLATKAWAIAQGLLNIAMDANPIGLIVLAVAGLVLGIIELWNHSKAFRDFWKRAWQEIQQAVHPVVQHIQQIIGNFTTWWNQHWTEIHEVLRVAWVLMSGYVRIYLTIMTTEIKLALQLIAIAWRIEWGAIKDLVTWVWGVMKAAITAFTKVIGDIIAVFLDLITGHWSKAWHDIQKLFHDYINGIMSIAGAWGKGFLKFWEDLGKNVIQGFINGVKSMTGAVKNLFGGLAHDISGTFTSLLHIASPSRVFYEHGRNTLLGYIQGIQAVAPQVRAALAAVGGSVASGGLPSITGGAYGGAIGGGRPTVNITANFAPGTQGYNDPRFLQYLQVQMQEAVLRYNVNNPNNGMSLAGGRL